MSQYTKGAWIRYSDVGEDGRRYRIRGEVVSVDAQYVHLNAEAPYGNVSVSVDEADKITVIKQPKSFRKFRFPSAKRDCKGTSVHSIEQKVRKARAVGPSKKQRAIEMYDSTMSRQEVINSYIDELDMTPAGAATYYAMAKKAS